MTLIHRKVATPRATARSKGGGGRSSRRRFRLPDRRRFVAGASALLIPTAFVVQAAGITPATAAITNPGPVGNGFVVTAGDLSFILKQIKISERHAATLTASNPCGTLVNQPDDGIPDADQVPDALTSYGLRTVDGSCNNLKDATTKNFAASDQVFPRLTSPVFRDAEDASAFGGPVSSSYKQLQGNVADSQPRVISNLIVDQTSTNPAAIQAAGHPVRT